MQQKNPVCQSACCGTDRFDYHTQFDSGTGWPSFYAMVSDMNIRLEHDSSGGLMGTGVVCARCGTHLGHVFNDGPPPTGKRCCMNSAALSLRREPDPDC